MNRAEIIRAAGLDPKREVCHNKCMDHRDRKPCNCYPGYSADAAVRMWERFTEYLLKETK